MKPEFDLRLLNKESKRNQPYKTMALKLRLTKEREVALSLIKKNQDLKAGPFEVLTDNEPKTYVSTGNDLALGFKTPFSKQWRDKEQRGGFSSVKVPKNFYNKFRTNILSEANAICEAVSQKVQNPIRLTENDEGGDSYIDSKVSVEQQQISI